MDAQQLISDETTTHSIADPFEGYIMLSRLRLMAGDLNELARQGFVSVERCGNRSVSKLRFRRNGRQVARSIGDTAMADLVKRELDRLQARRNICRELATLDRTARRLLRDAKAQLEPLMNANGWNFHGRDVRRPHSAKCRSRT